MMVRSGHWTAAFVALAWLVATPAQAGDPEAGLEKAVKCKQCHGLDGIGKLPIYPNIAGQSEVYLTKQLQEFRAGLRQDQMMTFTAKELSDEDIADLAAYYAAIEFTVILPE